jgi:hypothetical protein
MGGIAGTLYRWLEYWGGYHFAALGMALGR